MPAYANVSGTSPITSYDIDDDEQAITVRFQGTRRRPGGRTYLYTEESCPEHIFSLFDLAIKGQGLATYIARERPPYAERW